MNKKFKFYCLSIWLLLSRSYDAYATYQFTPTLDKEANPLVSIFNMGWSPLLITLSILTIIIIIIYSFYTATFKPMDLMPKEKGLSFSQFIGHVYLGEKSNWMVVLYKIPKDLKRFQYYLGNTMPQVLAIVGVVSTLMWIGINYTSFYADYHSPDLIYSLIIGLSGIYYYWWFRKGYKQYQKLENLVLN